MGSLSQKGYLGVPTFLDDEELHRRRLADAINGLLSGKLNNIATAKLRQHNTSTTISDARCGPDSALLITPTSLNAGTALTTWSVSARTSGSLVIEHISTSTSDCTLTYAIFG